MDFISDEYFLNQLLVPNFGRIFACHRSMENSDVFADFTFHPENIDIDPQS